MIKERGGYPQPILSLTVEMASDKGVTPATDCDRTQNLRIRRFILKQQFLMLSGHGLKQ